MSLVGCPFNVFSSPHLKMTNLVRQKIEPTDFIVLFFPVCINQIIAKGYKKNRTEESKYADHVEWMTEWQQPLYTLVMCEIVRLTHACNVIHILFSVDNGTNGYE